jgi:hypothetical protein
VQPKFSFAALLGGLIIFAVVVYADDWLDTLPNLPPVPLTMGEVLVEPVLLPAGDLAPLKLVGAWQLTSLGARIAGVSGLAVDGQGLVAIGDTGVVVRLPKVIRPGMQAAVRELPAGPGDPRAKINRDSEAVLSDPDGRGWWVAFERNNQLWLYDHRFSRALGAIAIPDRRLGRNSGIEGLAASQGAILAFPESGRGPLRLSGGRWREGRRDRRAPVADAAAIGERHFMLVERRITLRGFSNALVLVEANGDLLRTLWRKRLPVSWRDNVEGIAAERTPAGYRLWLATDNNFHRRMRTLLIVIDVPAAALPGEG